MQQLYLCTHVYAHSAIVTSWHVSFHHMNECNQIHILINYYHIRWSLYTVKKFPYGPSSSLLAALAIDHYNAVIFDVIFT